MFDKTFFNKIAYDLNVFKEYNPEELNETQYKIHYESLTKIANNILWRINTLKNLKENVDIPDFLYSLKYNYNFNNYNDLLKLLEDTKELVERINSEDKDVNAIKNALSSLLNKSQLHIQYISAFQSQKGLEKDREQKYPLQEQIDFSDPDKLYSSKQNIFNQLINNLKYQSSMLQNIGIKLTQGVQGKERYTVLENLNNYGKNLLASANNLKKYCQDNNKKVEKLTYPIKNTIGVIRSLVNEEEFTIFLKNINEAKRVIYSIE